MRPDIFMLTTLAASVSGLGINCRGSSNCGSFVFGNYANGNPLEQLNRLIQNNIDPSQWYNNGEQIACLKGSVFYTPSYICAFLPNSGGAPGLSIKNLLPYPIDHGCGTCSSVPLFFPGDNDVNNGILTLNSVSGGCGTGMC
ncbi:killer toxin [Aspergillus heterothallicus]